MAGVGLAGTDFGPWAVEAWPPLADAVVARYVSVPYTQGPRWPLK